LLYSLISAVLRLGVIPEMDMGRVHHGLGWVEFCGVSWAGFTDTVIRRPTTVCFYFHRVATYVEKPRNVEYSENSLNLETHNSRNSQFCATSAKNYNK